MKKCIMVGYEEEKLLALRMYAEQRGVSVEEELAQAAEAMYTLYRQIVQVFLNWGIRFEKPLEIPDRGSRPVHYAGKAELEQAILSECPLVYSEEPLPTQTTLKPVPIPEKTALKT